MALPSTLHCTAIFQGFARLTGGGILLGGIV